jgi:CRP-like cAMP-binding protein
VLLAAKLLIVAAAIITLIAVNALTATTLSLFLIVGQAFILVGSILALFVVATDFLRTRGMSRMHFEPGETIFSQGDPGDLVYAITEGEVEVLREAPNEEPRLLTTMGPGEYFGEMALLSDAVRTATVRARTAVDVVTMARADFTTLYAYVPNLRVTMERVMKEREARSARFESSRSSGPTRASLPLLLVLAGAVPAAAGDPAKGAEHFEKEGCPQCHGFKGKGDGYLLPMLKEKPTMRDWTNPASLEGMSDADLIEITSKGGEALGKSPLMLQFSHKLSPAQIADIVAWIRSLSR